MDTRVHTFEESQAIQESMIDTFSYKGNLIFVDNDMFIEDIFTKIKNSSEFKEFTKSNRFANLVKPDDLANDDKTDKSKKVDLGICDD